MVDRLIPGYSSLLLLGEVLRTQLLSFACLDLPLAVLCFAFHPLSGFLHYGLVVETPTILELVEVELVGRRPIRGFEIILGRDGPQRVLDPLQATQHAFGMGTVDDVHAVDIEHLIETGREPLHFMRQRHSIDPDSSQAF